MSLASPAIDVPPRRAEASRELRAVHTVVDLFSGAGGMSCGFQRHPAFEIVGAADAEIGKPSSRSGTLGCNASYERNIGVAPLALDLATIAPEDLRDLLALPDRPVVMSACAPCTGFTRTLARNHVVDDARNSLVGRVGEFARVLRPEVVVMENARELLMGRFAAHFAALRATLERLGYTVRAEIHVLSRFGLAQRRERALVVAVRDEHPARTLTDLWAGLAVREDATHVRRAIGHLPPVPAGVAHPSDPMHAAPRNLAPVNRRRLAAIPHDGGSWVDLVGHGELLAPSMRRRVALGDLGSHPDVYGRLWWDRPAVTIKRECGHIGNGRYAHPEQDRLCTVREMALLQGFPAGYELVATSITNRYRHVGDAVPPLVAYQVAALVSWILGADKPGPRELVLPGASLTPADVVETRRAAGVGDGA
jgi:DNA (cytosine-5)-methyltransferase 1